MADIIQFPEKRDSEESYIMVNCGERVHLIPLDFFRDVVKGHRKITDLDDWEDIVSALIGEIVEIAEEI